MGLFTFHCLSVCLRCVNSRFNILFTHICPASRYQTGRLDRWVAPAPPPAEVLAEQPQAQPQQGDPPPPPPPPPHDAGDIPPTQRASGVHTLRNTEAGETRVHTLRNTETGETSSSSEEQRDSTTTVPPPSDTPPVPAPAVQIQVQPSLVHEIEQFAINFFSSLLPGREANNNNNNNNNQQNQNMPVGGLFG